MVFSSFHKDTQNCRQGDGEKANTQLKARGGSSCGNTGCWRSVCLRYVHSWEYNLEGFHGVIPARVLAKHVRVACILTVVEGPYQVHSGGDLLVLKRNFFFSSAMALMRFRIKKFSLFSVFPQSLQKFTCQLNSVLDRLVDKPHP